MSDKTYSPAIRHAQFCIGNTRFDLHIYFSPRLPADTDGEQKFVTIHSHFYNEIIFAKEGGLEVQAGEKRLTLQQGDVIVFRKDFLHSLLRDSQAHFLSLGFTFEKDRAQGRQENTFPLFAKAFGAEYALYRKPHLSARFAEIAAAFRMISIVEAEHERRYLKLLSRLTDGNFFKRDGKIWWQCRNCGFVIEAEEAPKLCPACKHPQAYFEPKKENY